MINEAFPGKLVRVLKNIRRKAGGSHKQAYYVKRAAPGDVYDHGNGKLDAGLTPVESDENVQTDEEMTDQSPPRASFSIEVQPLEIPWLVQGTDQQEVDPIPPEIRKRYDPNYRSLRAVNPINANVPLFSLSPGEDMLWGSIEQELLVRLQSGTITAMLPASSANNTALIKLESTDGYVERAYVRFDKLFSKNKKLYNGIYNLDAEGSGPRRAAAAYELAKACGLDDIVPPTVCRYDEHNGLEPILPTDIMAKLAAHLEIGIGAISEQIGKFATVELWRDGGTLFCDQPWYGTLLTSNALNDPFSALPDDVRIAFMRAAVFDLLAWNGSRTWMDIVFYQDERHTIALRSNEITFPDPAGLAAALTDYPGSYSDGISVSAQYMPLIWSDPVFAAVVRGFDDDAELFEKIAIDCVSRVRGERVTDLIRALSDRQISPLETASTLVRIAMLKVGSKSIMRDPLIIPRYFSSLITGESFVPDFDIDLEELETSIDEIMSKALITEFSLRGEMNKEQEPDDRGQ